MATLCRDRVFLDAQLTAAAALPPLPPYRAPRWLAGAHAQTIWPAFVPLPTVRFRRERVATSDGDFWDFDWLDGAGGNARAPLVVLFHGLEGSSGSHYARALMHALAELGWRGVIPHFRGCGGEPNLRPRAYHSGDYEEIGAMLAAIRARAGAETVDPRRGHLARRQRAPQLARARRSRRGERAGVGCRRVDAARPHRRRPRHRPRLQPDLRVALPRDALAEEPRDRAPLPRRSRRGAVARPLLDVRIRRGGHGAAARIRGHPRLLASRVQQAMAHASRRSRRSC